MRPLVVSVALALTLLLRPHATPAQEAPPPPPTDTSTAADPWDVWAGIELSATQRTQMREIAAAARSRLQAAFGHREPGTPLTDPQRTLQRTVIAEQRAAIRLLLTAEQLARLDENLAARPTSTSSGSTP